MSVTSRDLLNLIDQFSFDFSGKDRRWDARMREQNVPLRQRLDVSLRVRFTWR